MFELLIMIASSTARPNDDAIDMAASAGGVGAAVDVDCLARDMSRSFGCDKPLIPVVLPVRMGGVAGNGSGGGQSDAEHGGLM